MTDAPVGYLGLEGRVRSGPSASLVDSGYRLEIEDAGFLHRGLGLADLAHVIELSDIGVVPAAAAGVLGAELLRVLATSARDFPYDPVYGDAYNSRERELERRLGALAGWLPAGRTRREAGRIAFRLALRAALLDLHEAVAGFGVNIVGRARQLAAAAWNDTTYLQPAQPSTFGHYLGGFAEQSVRDLERLRRIHWWVNQSPAGVGGVAGTAIPIDRTRMAAMLGFEGPAPHTRDAMWSVDILTDVLVAATQSVLTADRLAEDLEIFASPQFGYVALAGSVSRASVLLPQKRNPYALAVIRGGAGTLIGRTTGIMATQRTPSARTDNWLYAYGEVMGSVQLATRLLRLASDVVAEMEVDTGALLTSAGAHFSVAADITEQLVLHHGLDYRTAYRLVGRAVADAVSREAVVLEARDLTSAARALGIEAPDGVDDVVVSGSHAALLALGRDTLGGSAPQRVEEHCHSVEGRIRESEAWAAEAQRRTNGAERRLVEQATNRWS